MKKLIFALVALSLYSCNTQDQFVQVQDKDLYLNKFVTTGVYPSNKRDSIQVVKKFWKQANAQLNGKHNAELHYKNNDTVIISGVKFKVTKGN